MTKRIAMPTDRMIPEKYIWVVLLLTFITIATALAKASDFIRDYHQSAVIFGYFLSVCIIGSLLGHIAHASDLEAIIKRKDEQIRSLQEQLDAERNKLST